MHHRFLALCGAIVVVGVGVSHLVTLVTAQTRTAAVTSSTAEAKNWKPARTPWGHPDLSGVYSNSDENGIAFSRTPQQVLRIVYLTDEDGATGGGFYPKGMNGTLKTT